MIAILDDCVSALKQGMLNGIRSSLNAKATRQSQAFSQAHLPKATRGLLARLLHAHQIP